MADLLDWLASLLPVAGLGLWAVFLSIHVLAVLYSLVLRRRLAKGETAISTRTEPWPAVTIIKPLKSAEAHLRANLATFFTLDYDQYELLFCMEDEEDSARATVEELIAEFTRAAGSGRRWDAHMLFGVEPTGINPKIKNISKAYSRAKHDLVWICDSGVRAEPHSLKQLVLTHTQSPAGKVGMAHQIPCILPGSSLFQDAFQQVFFATQHAHGYLFSNLIGENCVNGMSHLFSKSAFDKLAPSLQAFNTYIAEDYFMSKVFFENGFKHRLAPLPAFQRASALDLKDILKRQVRWARLRRTMMPGVAIIEPLSESVLLSVVASLSFPQLFPEWSVISFLCIHFGAWLFLDVAMAFSIHGWKLPPPQIFLKCWILRELLAFPLLVLSWTSNKLEWRGKFFLLEQGGKATLVEA